MLVIWLYNTTSNSQLPTLNRESEKATWRSRSGVCTSPLRTSAASSESTAKAPICSFVGIVLSLGPNREQDSLPKGSPRKSLTWPKSPSNPEPRRWRGPGDLDEVHGLRPEERSRDRACVLHAPRRKEGLLEAIPVVLVCSEHSSE